MGKVLLPLILLCIAEAQDCPDWDPDKYPYSCLPTGLPINTQHKWFTPWMEHEWLGPRHKLPNMIDVEMWNRIAVAWVCAAILYFKLSKGFFSKNQKVMGQGILFRVPFFDEKFVSLAMGSTMCAMSADFLNTVYLICYVLPVMKK